MSSTEPVNGVWKSLALIVVTILIAGSPGMIYALRTWSVSTRVDLIQTRQDDVRDRLTRLEAQHEALVEKFTEQTVDLQRLQAQVDSNPLGPK